MPQLLSDWIRQTKQGTPLVKEWPARSAIEAREKGCRQELAKYLGSQPFYIAPTREQSGHTINIDADIALIKHTFRGHQQS